MKNTSSIKIKDWFPLVLVTGFLLFLFSSLKSNLSERFQIIEQDIASKDALCLSNANAKDIAQILLDKNYVPSKEDADFVSHFLSQKIVDNDGIESLYDIAKRSYRVTPSEVDSLGGQMHKEMMCQMRQDLELYDSAFCNASSQQDCKVVLDDKLNGEISVLVNCKNDSASFLDKILKKDFFPSPGVLVRLNEHYLSDHNKAEVRTLAVLRTNEDGKVLFAGLDKRKSYSVLPIQEGYQFGNAKGTIHSTLEELDKCEFKFDKSPLLIPLLSNTTLNKIKEDGTIIVRTPVQFVSTLNTGFLSVLTYWWIFYIVMCLLGKRVDTMLLSALMGLTGICSLVMFSLNNPLTDSLIGPEMSKGILYGCILLSIMQFFDPIKYYQNKYIIPFDPLSRISGAKGYIYLILAVGLTLLLFPLGKEVGGMKVNLDFGILFQPSEISKYLIIFFMAAYFCQNVDVIREYSRKGKTKLTSSKIRFLMSLIIGFAILMVLYLVLQDLGPAMVVIFTFIILYSIIKSKEEENENFFTSDFSLLLFGVISFMLVEAVVFYVFSSIYIRLFLSLLWFVLWIVVGNRKFQMICESPLLFNLVLMAFIFGGFMSTLPIETLSKIGERLEARVSMCTNTWGAFGVPALDGTSTQNATENSQVVDGLWGIASGGLSGQGLTNGECTLIPAFNTDMILESIGTQLGFFGILLVLALYCILLRRTLVVGYKSKHLFSFFLCVGIAVVTGVQLIIISLGSVGMIPLTGITVPLLSYGKVSMILNLVAFGIVLSISSKLSSQKRNANNVVKYEKPLALLSLSFFALATMIASTFFYYQFIDRNDVLVRPALVKSSNGVSAVKYNPRIALITDKMRVGNIYDRKGVLIATSDYDELAKYNADYEKCHIGNLEKRSQKRYYPFGEHLYFMLGDYNSKLFMHDPNRESNRGLMAEYEYMDSLRGYDNIKKDSRGDRVTVEILPAQTHVGRFIKDKLPAGGNSGFTLRDYSALVPYLKKGINSKKVRNFNNDDEGFFAIGKIKPADIHLTVDAVLQTKLQQNIQTFVQEDPILKNRKKVRVSAVVLEADNGEILASANYPLPDISQLGEQSQRPYNDKSLSSAYTDMDLGLCYPTSPGSTAKVISAMSGFMKYGSGVSGKKYYVRSEEKPTADASEPSQCLGKLATMDNAIAYSSNVYFIKYVNELDLYDKLGVIYENAGIIINAQRPYSGLVRKDKKTNSIWTDNYYRLTSGARDAYLSLTNSVPRKRLTGNPAWNLAWGQNPMTATPLAMAKAYSIVANDGRVVDFSLVKGTQRMGALMLMDKGGTLSELKTYMTHEATNHTSVKISEYGVAGKTGTVTRGANNNDGWYVCCCKGVNGNIVIALRIERGGSMKTNGFSSAKAKQMVQRVVLSSLDELGYIRKSNKS